MLKRTQVTSTNVDVNHRSHGTHGTLQGIHFYCKDIALIPSQSLPFSQKLMLAFCFGAPVWQKALLESNFVCFAMQLLIIKSVWKLHKSPLSVDFQSVYATRWEARYVKRAAQTLPKLSAFLKNTSQIIRKKIKAQEDAIWSISNW